MQLRHLMLLLILCLVALTACNRTEVELSFETIENSQNGKNYGDKSPGIKIITSSEEVDTLKNLISSEAIESLSKLDYSYYVGIILFHGVRGNGGYQINVNKVMYDGMDMYIYSTFTEPAPDELVTMDVTSPYHIVKIEKPYGIEDNWWTTFILYDEDQEVARHRVTIPKTIAPSSIISPLSPLKNKEME